MISEYSDEEQPNDAKYRRGSIEYRNSLALAQPSSEETMVKMSFVGLGDRHTTSNSLNHNDDRIDDW